MIVKVVGDVCMRLVGRVRVRGVGYRAQFASLTQCYIFHQI